MEDQSASEKSSATGRSASRLLRYPLRSAVKSKGETLPLSDFSNSSQRRERFTSSVSKSVNVIDISGKDKSTKLPRRLSNPSKSCASTVTKVFGDATPISETRGKRPAGNQGKSDTPVSNISNSSNRNKYCLLSSSSYWVSQIKLSESANQHKVSLGFFKLALEAGCEPMQKMRDELKRYVNCHNMPEFEVSVKELFDGYKIPENLEQLDISETCSQVPSEANQLADDDIHSCSSATTDAEKLKPKSLITDADEICQVEKMNKETSQKNSSLKNNRKSSTKNAPSSQSGSNTRGRSTQKKSQKPIKTESVKDQEKMNKGRGASQPGPRDNILQKEACQEDKENLEMAQIKAIAGTEVDGTD